MVSLPGWFPRGKQGPKSLLKVRTLEQSLSEVTFSTIQQQSLSSTPLPTLESVQIAEPESNSTHRSSHEEREAGKRVPSLYFYNL